MNPVRSGRKQRQVVFSGCRKATWSELANCSKPGGGIDSRCTAHILRKSEA